MCGISGIVSKSNKEVSKIRIKIMNDLIAHRGPDSEGYFFYNNFAFGHKRLSILDLSSAGHQPLHYLDKFTITYNGEVYNYIELKEELTTYGYTFQSDTDTEVILASYDKWGDRCVNRFNGMWAFAIHDKTNNIIFCSRDRFGIKPFYYTETDNFFVFGSEIKQLLGFHETNYVNKRILFDYLLIGYEEHTNETFFENILKLEQSHNLVYDLDNNSFEVYKYYELTFNKDIGETNEESAIEAYRKRLIKSINLRLRSDVKVGTCLSGGLDSSAIASVASAAYHSASKDKFIAIHAKSTQKDNDESGFAQQVSDHCDLDLKFVEPTTDDFISNIDEIIFTQEEPFGGPSIFMQYFVMKKAQAEGCKVMLDGQGGDETLLGYERYYPAYFLSLGFVDILKELFYSSKNSNLSIKQLLLYMLYFTAFKIRKTNLKSKNKHIKKEFLDFLNENVLRENAKNYLNIFELQKQEILSTQMPHLLRYEDKNSMRNSIETRLPFIDFRVLETALSLKNNLKVNKGWTKYVLRKALDDLLPSSVVWRKNKFGFEAPTKTWLNDEQFSKEMQNAVLQSKIVTKLTIGDNYFSLLNDNQKWKLFNIAKWEKLYNVEIR